MSSSNGHSNGNGHGNGHGNGNGHSNGHGNGNHLHSRWWHSLWKPKADADEDLAAYRRLALQLHYELPRADARRSALLVTPTDSSPCVPASAVLASCLAEQISRPVLLIDASTPGSRHGESAIGRGLSDCLADPSLSLHDLVSPTTSPNVHYLSGGTSRPLATENFDALLTKAENQYDFVLLTGGSVLKDPVSLAIAPCVGCVLLLVIPNQTRVEDLDSAQSALGYCKARRVGMLLTTPARSGVWPL